MDIHELKESIANDSTIMGAEKEIFYIESLMSLPREEILCNWEAFSEILDRLFESHTQTFFEVTEQNKGTFVQFADWLVELGKSLSDVNEAKSLAEFANNFRIDPMEVFGKKAE